MIPQVQSLIEEIESLPEGEIKTKLQAKIEEFSTKAINLTEQQKGRKVDYHTFSLRDDNGNLTGEIYAIYTVQPAEMLAASCMDDLVAGKRYMVGMKLWSTCVLKESDKEITENQARKLGMAGRLGVLIDVILPDVKKN